ncbi:MAG: aminotransferase class V-fold PLP-dependent enzyme [Steroidobacteraceae bacterium]
MNGVRRTVLLCPGPVQLSPGVREALATCGVGHRDARFSDVVARLRTNLAKVLGAGASHSVMLVTGPATAGLEAAFASLLPRGTPVVVPVNGTFGARIAEMLSTLDLDCRPVDLGFGQPFDLGRLESALDGLPPGRPAALAMTHHETSCGLLNPIAAACALARRRGVPTFVDATSSAGAEDLDLARDGVDVCVTASGKCLHAAPGIAIVAARRDLLDAAAGRPRRTFALDLVRHHEQAEANSQTPFTPAVPLVLALDRAVEELLARGVPARRAEYLRRRARMAAGFARLGLAPLQLPAGAESASILTVATPEPPGFEALYASLRERGYLLYAAKPPLGRRYFQASVMGELDDRDVDAFLGSLEDVLAASASRRAAGA